MKRCTHCVLSETTHNTSFDMDSVSKYYRHDDHHLDDPMIGFHDETNEKNTSVQPALNDDHLAVSGWTIINAHLPNNSRSSYFLSAIHHPLLLHQQQVYFDSINQGIQTIPCQVAEQVCRREVHSLPVHPGIIGLVREIICEMTNTVT